MLRRKMLLTLFCQMAILMILAVVSLWSLHGIFTRLDRLNRQSQTIMQQASTLNSAISTIHVQLYAPQSDHPQQLDAILKTFKQMEETAQQIGQQPVLEDAQIRPAYQSLTEQLAAFKQHIMDMANRQETLSLSSDNLLLFSLAAKVRKVTLQVTGYAYSHIEKKQQLLTEQFRKLVIGLAIGFVLVVNVSILLLIRTSVMILKPMDELVKASHELAQEHFDYRLNLKFNDEFDELAEAYNNLAQQLGENENRKLEVLSQVALTLNHELNNAVAIIELQLNLLQRRTNNPAAIETSLRKSHESLQRMARVIDALKRIRRIVLTDYVEGVKMLDLERSIQENDPQVTEVSTSPHGAKAREKVG